MKLLVVIVSNRVTKLTVDCLHSVAGEIEHMPGTREAVCENGTGGDAAEKRIQQSIDDSGWGAWCTLTVISPNPGFTGRQRDLAPRNAGRGSAAPFSSSQRGYDRATECIQGPDRFHGCASGGIAGCRIEQPDGLIQRSAFRFQSPASEFEGNIRLGLVTRLLRRWMVAPPSRNETFATDWVSYQAPA